MYCRLLLIGCFLVSCGQVANASDQRGVVLPPVAKLHGAHARQRILLEFVRDEDFVGAAADVRWQSSNTEVARVENGMVVPVGDGSARITGTSGNTVAHCEVTVSGMRAPSPWEFSRHVLPVLTKAGCNSGACHGALAGKGGFKLSLRGYNAGADHWSITEQARSRRIELADPGRSLLLAKPTMALPHKGGLRLEVDDANYNRLAAWITQGAPGPTADDAQLIRLDIFPEASTLAVGAEQPLLVRAIYDDGREEDVTPWARFEATAQAVAKVDDQGQVTVTGHGEGAVVATFGNQLALFRATVPFPAVDQPSPDAVPRRNFIDDLVLAQLARLRLVPSGRTSDHAFLRRVYLDVIGTLPTVPEVEAFTADARPDKRDRAIETLLARAEFVDFWTYKWSDVLLVNGRRLRPIAVRAYYDWIRGHVRDNTPWDQVVREIVTATGETKTNGATNFYSLHQSPEEMTENVCQAFLSLSIGCAKCHNHPLEKWTNDQYYAMASHFSRVRAKGWGGDGRNGDGVRTLFLASQGELVQPTTGKPQPPTPLDGEPLSLAATGDRRAHLADWLTDKENPYFARATANRIWSNFFGIGLVNPIDDLRMSNPASNEPLLEALADFLVETEFDLKALMRVILQSETYQRSSESLPGNRADTQFFSRYFPRRLSAEVLLDAIATVTDVPTEFTQIGFDGADVQRTEDYPLGTRAIQLADSAVVSNFLKTFGRNERDITCECERSNTPSIVQVLHINNGVTINDRLSAETSCVSQALERRTGAERIVEEAYLKALGRRPQPEERAGLVALLTEASGDERRAAIEDLYWSILSSREFLFNH